MCQDQMLAAQSDESWRCDHSRSEWSWYDAQAAFGPMIGPTLRPVTVILLLNSWLGCNPLNSITSPFARLCKCKVAEAKKHWLRNQNELAESSKTTAALRRDRGFGQVKRAGKDAGFVAVRVTLLPAVRKKIVRSLACLLRAMGSLGCHGFPQGFWKALQR